MLGVTGVLLNEFYYCYWSSHKSSAVYVYCYVLLDRIIQLMLSIFTVYNLSVIVGNKVNMFLKLVNI